MLCLECLEEGEIFNTFILPSFSTLSVSSRKASKALASPSQQRLHKLQLLQDVRCQKPCMDQVRLSSLINKLIVDVVFLLNFHRIFLLIWPENIWCNTVTGYKGPILKEVQESHNVCMLEPLKYK